MTNNDGLTFSIGDTTPQFTICIEQDRISDTRYHIYCPSAYISCSYYQSPLKLCTILSTSISSVLHMEATLPMLCQTGPAALFNLLQNNYPYECPSQLQDPKLYSISNPFAIYLSTDSVSVCGDFHQ